MTKTPAPGGLSEHGLALWKAITSEVELRADERPLLEDACRATDRIAEMRDLLDSEGYLSTGSMGQTILHPLVAEIRSHEAHVSQLLAKLKISEAVETSGGASDRSSKAREAANVKWLTPHGKAS